MEKLFGIDISHWQGDMSIEQARNERGVKFAIIKAAGADDGKYKDSKFENYYAQCKAIGLPVGAYYYGNAKSVAEAEQEADHFLSVIAGKQFEYPIYYDVEGKMLNNSRDVLTNIVIAFCDRCEKAGYFVGVYTSDSHFQAHVDDDRLQRFTHWVARYSSNEPVTGHDIWQYGESITTLPIRRSAEELWIKIFAIVILRQKSRRQVSMDSLPAQEMKLRSRRFQSRKAAHSTYFTER